MVRPKGRESESSGMWLLVLALRKVACFSLLRLWDLLPKEVILSLVELFPFLPFFSQIDGKSSRPNAFPRVSTNALAQADNVV